MWHLQHENDFKRILFIYFQRQGKGERMRGRQASMCGCLWVAPYGVLSCNPGMCLDWESNPRTLGSHTSTQSTGPHQPQLKGYFILSEIIRWRGGENGGNAEGFTGRIKKDLCTIISGERNGEREVGRAVLVGNGGGKGRKLYMNNNKIVIIIIIRQNNNPYIPQDPCSDQKECYV